MNPRRTCSQRGADNLVCLRSWPPANSLDLYQRALECSISVAPGPAFSASQGYRNFIRVNCGFRWCDRIEEAVIVLGRLATELASQR